MRSSKSRSRNKSNRQRTLGNVVNRVFDSSGPEGKVRGTPQQIIEKYLTLARDAQLSNDRVAEQSFLQHAEHYTRMLGEAQREQAERQSQNGFHRDDDRDDTGQHGDGSHNNGGQNNGGQNNGGQQHAPRQDRDENGHRRDDNRRDDNRRDDNRRDQQNRRDDNRNDNRQDRRDFRRDDRGDENRQNDRRDDQPRAPRAEPVAADQGLPPVIATDVSAGPVDTPETVAPEAAPAPAAPAPAAPELPLGDAALDGAAESFEPASDDAPKRRRTRSPAAAGAAPRAPRTRRKPAAEGDQPAAEKASGE
ncbi:DUF4167 domain-containing protein [Paracoccus shanxieyensis]|uniref:DUF4167 domain-containing protein n=1 Tax=Paracoccus shanxieyensis TaxID=2675752 RepID=A0A6L6IX50_9RHOB|nr:DUF4167 domain-containing protein [Paracoccus shanxieyensis]MTH65095.1 DUF4167 domain-containing protein [Paracoccus shanxieyensis]MTH88239.1 DUF4167 domain-containing protein [Paracoccus shanxieyensis]